MALIKTNADIIAVIPVNASVQPDTVIPDCEWAEEKFLVPVIGADQYDELHTAYHGSDPLTDPQIKILKHCQKIVLHLAYAKYSIINQLNISNRGISTIKSNQETTAWQYQITDLKEDYCIEKGFDFVDILLAYLEGNKVDYPLWANSDAYTVSKQFFINSEADFSQYVGINHSRRTFMHMWPALRVVEETILEASLGAEFVALLKSKILAGTITSDEQVVVNKIKPVVIYHTACEALETLPLKVKHGGFVVDALFQGTENIKERKAPQNPFLSASYKRYKDNADTYMGRVLEYLNNNASSTKFATFYTSKLYRGIDAQPPIVENDPTSGMFMP